MTPEGMGRSREELHLALWAGVLLLFFWVGDALLAHLFNGGEGVERFLMSDAQEGCRVGLVFLLGGALCLYFINVLKKRGAREELMTKALEKALAEHARVEAIVEAVGDGISIQDTEFNILYQNAAHQALFGSHCGKHCYVAYKNEAQLCDGCLLLESFGDGAVHRKEMTFLCNDKTRRTEITASSLKDRDGRIIAGIEVVREVTAPRSPPPHRLAEGTSGAETVAEQHPFMV